MRKATADDDDGDDDDEEGDGDGDVGNIRCGLKFMQF